MTTAIKVGQVWACRTQRDRGKQVTVIFTEEHSVEANPFVIVQRARMSRMRESTLRSRYTLVKEAP